MSFLSHLGSLFGGQDAQRMAAGQGDFQNRDSPDMQRMQTMLSRMDPKQSSVSSLWRRN